MLPKTKHAFKNLGGGQLPGCPTLVVSLVESNILWKYIDLNLLFSANLNNFSMKTKKMIINVDSILCCLPHAYAYFRLKMQVEELQINVLTCAHIS